MDAPLIIVLDEWARPADDMPVVLSQGEYVISARRAWMLDSLIAASIMRPGSLSVVTRI